MKKKIKTGIWLAVALLALAFLVYKTPEDAFREAIRQVRWTWAVAAVLLQLVAQTILALRWVLLLRIQRVYITLFQAIKLTYLGLFYNNMMPGAVGGDLLKGWYVTHHSDKELRLQAAVTVLVDRLVGLIGMMLVGAIASFIVGGVLRIHVSGREVQVRSLIWVIFTAMVLVSVVFLSRRIRRALMLKWLLEKLPFAKELEKIDKAIRIYRRHKLVMFIALSLTALIQGLSIAAVWFLTQALHFEMVTFHHCLIIMPIVWLISAAIPVPGGLGVMENLFIPFFSAAISPDGSLLANGQAAAELLSANGQAAALALLNRMLICACSLPGALVPIFGGHLPKASELERENE